MIEVNHKPATHDENCYEIVGDSIDELVNDGVNRVRAQSKGYYRKELKRDLWMNGISWIDRHAGMGSSYTVILKKV